MFERLFLDHPRSVQESYWAHLCAAFGFAMTMLVAGLAVSIHALIPCLFERTASRTVAQLHDRMIANRRAGTPPGRAER